MQLRLWGPAGEFDVRLALDTGAEGTIVPAETAILAGYDLNQVLNHPNMTTASGVVQVPRIQVDRVEALGLERRNFALVCHTLPPDADVQGLLGLDFFRGQKLTIDFRAGLVSVE